MVTCPSCGTGVQEPANFCPGCGERLKATTPLEELKVVTVAFCDVVHSTELGQKLELVTLRRTMDRFAETARRVLAGHGGQVGALHGDSVIAVFGIPVAHDDDALRAVRAALELQEALGLVGEDLYREHGVPFKVRVGVNTGKVLVHDADPLEERITGHTVNVAKRLQEATEAGGVLIGEETYQLVRDAVRSEKVPPLALEGVVDPVLAYRLLDVLPGRPGRVPRLQAPMIGRDLEHDLLRSLFERVVNERSCHLVTVLGRAGVGKTRLADEFARGLGDRALVLQGQCLAYGDSVTFWPMMQIVRQAAEIAPTDAPATAHERLLNLVSGDERDRQALSQIEQLLGVGEKTATDLPGDTSWALRRLLESLARRRPVALLIEDLQWAEPILLDTLESIAESAQDTPILLLCMARPDELFERRRHWAGGRLNATSLLLSPLSNPEGEQLVEHLLGSRQLDPEALAHITYLAQGYPLIVEELVATLVERGVLRLLEGRWIATTDLTETQAPPTIYALLAARLDRLEQRDRRVIERAAVVGEQFHDADIEALSPEMTPAQVAARLDALVRQELIQHDHAVAAPMPTESPEGFRFRHILSRNVVYERMTEPVRAELHERFADWLERTAGDRLSQFDELMGYHLHEAYRYRRKLGPVDEHARKLARRAGERYAAAGQRAALRGDIPLTSAWLGRASRLLAAEHPTRLRVLPDLADALQAAGDLRRALRVYDDIVETATAAGDHAAALHAELGRLHVAAFQNHDAFLRDGRGQVERVMAELEPLGDQLGLAKGWYLLGYLDWAVGWAEAARTEVERALGLVRTVGNERWEAYVVRLHCLVMYWGPAPLAEVERHNHEALDLARRTGMRNLEAGALTIFARAAAMRGDFDTARRYNQQAVDITTDLGELLTQAADSMTEGGRGRGGAARRLPGAGADGWDRPDGQRGGAAGAGAAAPGALRRGGGGHPGVRAGGGRAAVGRAGQVALGPRGGAGAAGPGRRGGAAGQGGGGAGGEDRPGRYPRGGARRSGGGAADGGPPRGGGQAVRPRPAAL